MSRTALNLPVAELWYRAREARVGIGVRVSDVLRFKSALYAERAKLADDSLAHLSIRTSPQEPDRVLWIVPRGAPSTSDLAPPPTPE